jgi:hypothetical protein
LALADTKTPAARKRKRAMIGGWGKLFPLSRPFASRKGER